MSSGKGLARSPTAGTSIGNGHSTVTTTGDWFDSAGNDVESLRTPTKKIAAMEPSAELLDFEKIYPEKVLLSSQLQSAHKLLSDATARLKLSITALEEEDEIRSDDHLHYVISSLREAFLCRDLGDGFGALVSSSLAALENLAGEPATMRQVITILRCVERARIEPYISRENSDAEIDRLETAGLNVEPAGVAPLEDLLNE